DGVDAAQARATELLPHVDAAQAQLARLVQRLAREDVLLVALGGERRELGVGEVADRLEDRLALLGGDGGRRNGGVDHGHQCPSPVVAGMTKLAPSRMPDGQRLVTVLVFVSGRNAAAPGWVESADAGRFHSPSV